MLISLHEKYSLELHQLIIDTETNRLFPFVPGDSSIVVSMELNGVGYQGVLFAQPRTARV